MIVVGWISILVRWSTPSAGCALTTIAPLASAITTAPISRTSG
jgi:hypothetical protein